MPIMPAPGLGQTLPQTKDNISFPSPLEFVRNAYSEDTPIPAAGGTRETQDVTVLVEKAENGDMDWKQCLETIFNMDTSNFDQETYGN